MLLDQLLPLHDVLLQVQRAELLGDRHLGHFGMGAAYVSQRSASAVPKEVRMTLRRVG